MGGRQKRPKRTWWSGIVAAVWLWAALAVEAYGAEARVVSAMVSDGFIYIYLQGVSELREGTLFQIGAKVCPRGDVAVGNLDSLETPMRTILLVDNSKSIPEKNHEDIRILLEGIVAGAMEGEQIRIGTISDQLAYQCEFTTDKEALNQVIEGITYSNQDTYLSDILYDVIASLEQENTGVLTRIVIFADGADDKAIGYTNEEVRRIIEKGAYPVYAIGFPKGNNFAQLETMFSFARASFSEYYLADGTVTHEEIINGLLLDQKDLCVRIRPDESLLDGSSRNIRLKLSTEEGDIELTATVQMPFGDGKEPETETEAEMPESHDEPETPETKPAEETLPSIAPRTGQPDSGEKNGDYLWLYVGVGVLAAMAAAVWAVWVFRGKRKGKSQGTEDKTAREKDGEGKEENGSAADIDGAEDETILIRKEEPDNARPLWEKKQYCVTLWNLDQPDISYTAAIQDVVRIGRVGNDINIDDETVSKKHCELILRGQILYIKDVGSKNGTKHHNVRIDGEISIASGEVVEIGRCRYRVVLDRK